MSSEHACDSASGPNLAWTSRTPYVGYVLEKCAASLCPPICRAKGVTASLMQQQAVSVVAAPAQQPATRSGGRHGSGGASSSSAQQPASPAGYIKAMKALQVCMTDRNMTRSMEILQSR